MPLQFDFAHTVFFLSGQLGSNVGFAILDGDNALKNPNPVDVFSRWMDHAATHNLRLLIVAKTAHINRLKTRLPAGIVLPDDLLYFFLHGDNKRCPDDAFIIELHAHLRGAGIDSTVFSSDMYRNRDRWMYHPTLISHNLSPKRPRNAQEPGSIIYTPTRGIVMSTVLTTHVLLTGGLVGGAAAAGGGAPPASAGGGGGGGGGAPRAAAVGGAPRASTDGGRRRRGRGGGGAGASHEDPTGLASAMGGLAIAGLPSASGSSEDDV